MSESRSGRVQYTLDTVAVALGLALTLASPAVRPHATPGVLHRLWCRGVDDPDADRCRSSGGVWRNNAAR